MTAIVSRKQRLQLRNFLLFIRGAEILNPIIDENGNPSGIYLNLTQNNAVLNRNHGGGWLF
ncbi:MAG: hypothetical protein AAFQ80_11700 [Cyanobacteria bacterium J06621_8]